MALRDRQISGVPLTKGQSAAISIFLTALVPVIGYHFWYPFLHIPEELRPWIAAIGMAINLGMSIQIVPNNVERNLLWMGSYTGASFSNGICLIPRAPIPILLLGFRLLAGEEAYKKFLWSLEGDVRVESIPMQGIAEGLSKDGALMEIEYTLVLEVGNAAIFRSQTRNDTDRQVVLDIVRAEYNARVKASVLRQHTAEELQSGMHSGGSQVLNEWMTGAWKLMADFGVELTRSPIALVRFKSEHVRQAWERAQAEGIFTAGAESFGKAFSAYRAKNPGLSEEIAWASFAASQGLPAGTSINILKFK
jgi:hypothetical protein